MIAQQYFDKVIATGQNHIAGISHPALEIGDTIFTFIKNDYRYRYGFPTSLLKLGKDGGLYSNELYLDTIDSYRIFDAVKETGNILICGVRQLQMDGSRIIMYGALNANMDTVWTKTISSKYNHPGVYKIIRLQNGNITMVGDDSHIRPTGGAYSNKNHAIFILTDSLGNILRYTHFEKPDSNNLEVLNYIMQSGSGDIYCVGENFINTTYNKGLIIKLSKDGEFIWRREIEQSKYGYFTDFCKELSNGNILLVGSKYLPFFIDSAQVWTSVIVIDSSGKKIKENNFFRNFDSNNSKCITDQSGNIICVGGIIDSDTSFSRGYLIKLNSNGDSIYRREFTHGWTDRDQVFFNIANASDGGYYLTGFNWVQGDNSSKAWIVKVDSNGCVVPGCNTAVNVEPTEYDELFLVYPNPVSDKLTIFLNDQTYEVRAYTLSIYDINGREVIQKKIQGMRSNFDFTNYSQGMYMYRILYGGRVIQSGKVVKG